MANLKGSAIVGQSGGPTSVINASLAGLVEALCGCDCVDRVLGMRYGIEGFMEDNVIDLGKEAPETIAGLKSTPSSALGSCRHKLQDDDFPRILEGLRKYDIRYVFLIGGNDTMDTIHRLEAYCAENDYELIGVGVPKTVDNDLYGTDHTPGFGSAARYVALSVMQEGVLARDMQRVDRFAVFQTVGRDAGWLAAASALGKRTEEAAPHLIYMPETDWDRDAFLRDVEATHKKYGFVSIVCGEGIHTSDGKPVSASTTADKFANVEFGAMGGTSAAMVLHKIISDEFGFRGEFEVPESLQMCAADRASGLDIEEAYACGQEAVRLAMEGTTGVMVSIVRDSTDPYSSHLETAPLKDVAVKAKPMPRDFINEAGNFPTQKFLDYARPLIGELPHYAQLQNVKA